MGSAVALVVPRGGDQQVHVGMGAGPAHLPTTFVISRDGTIVKRRSGIGSREQFERDVKALL
jgi:hypothetical protein